MGLDDGALDTEFTIGGTEAKLFKQMGTPTIDGIQLRFTGSIQRDDTGEVQAVELVTRGRYKELDSGEWKTADSNTTKVSATNSYAKLTINGECSMRWIWSIWFTSLTAKTCWKRTAARWACNHGGRHWPAAFIKFIFSGLRTCVKTLTKDRYPGHPHQTRQNRD